MLMDLIEERHSIRKYTDQQISRENCQDNFPFRTTDAFLYDGKYGSAGN